MTEPKRPARRSHWRPRALPIGLLSVQIICAIFFLYEITVALFGLRTEPLPWFAHELIEIGAALGLILGAAVGGYAFVKSERGRRNAEARLASVSRAFHELLDERFSDWKLTPAEIDVAYFVVKGFSIHEIATMRNTSDGTVKAQTAAIYRKAKVTGRGQLLSHFIDELMDDTLVASSAQARAAE